MGGEGLMERVEMLSQGLSLTAFMAPSRFGDEITAAFRAQSQHSGGFHHTIIIRQAGEELISV